MKLEEIEHELKNALEEETSIQNDLLSVWALQYGENLIAVAKAAKKLSKDTYWQDGPASLLEEKLFEALEELERE